jgi:hypothetical protein
VPNATWTSAWPVTFSTASGRREWHDPIGGALPPYRRWRARWTLIAVRAGQRLEQVPERRHEIGSRLTDGAADCASSSEDVSLAPLRGVESLVSHSGAGSCAKAQPGTSVRSRSASTSSARATAVGNHASTLGGFQQRVRRLQCFGLRSPAFSLRSPVALLLEIHLDTELHEPRRHDAGGDAPSRDACVAAGRILGQYRVGVEAL